MAQWLIETVEISGGFLDGLSLRLPAGLTCVIGPRGSGKSTLAEALRLILCGVPNGAPRARLDFLRANLGAATLSLTTASATDRGAFTVRRSFGHPASLTTTDGRAVTGVDLDRGTFLPLDAYSSVEIEDIANESLGEKRRSLLDELCAAEMHEVLLNLADQRRALEANADAITAAQRRLSDLVEQSEELGDAQARLATLPTAPSRGGTPEFQASSRQRQSNAHERENLEAAIAAVSRLKATLATSSASAKRQLSNRLVVDSSANVAVLSDAERAIAEMWSKVDIELTAAGRAIDAAELQLSASRRELATVHAQQESDYLALQQQNTEAAQAIELRTAAERDVATLGALAASRAATVAELQRLEDQRTKLRAEYLVTRDRVAELRESVATKLEGQTGAKVRVRLLRNADTLAYQSALTQALYGSKLKNQDEILRSLLTLRPETLAQIIRENDVTELDAHATFGKERCRKILDSLRQNLSAATLEIIPIDDSVRIELNVASSDAPSFKDAAELSRGQKCTALLPLLLARRDSPLIIDQPEDNLDNHFIYETVVESIRRIKSKRQLMFITHNANIPVLGEAELVVVLNSDGQRGYIERAGSVDECRQEIIDLLEGGEEAFELRRRRYVRP